MKKLIAVFTEREDYINEIQNQTSDLAILKDVDGTYWVTDRELKLGVDCHYQDFAELTPILWEYGAL